MIKIVAGYVTNASGTYTKPVRVRRVKPLEPYRARITFTDGSTRTIDLDHYLRGPVFSPIRKDPELFKAMFVDEGTLAWPGDVDIDPDTLYYGENPVPWQSEPKKPIKKRASRTLTARKADANSNNKSTLKPRKRVTKPSTKSKPKRAATKNK